MKKQLLLLSFIEGGAVMAAELSGARLLSPIFGGSLYVWAAVMGITLGALALGYFFGGRLSSQEAKRSARLHMVLSLAALFVMAMPLISHYLVPRLSYLPFLTGVVLSCFCLLFFPVFFLGASSPFFIALQSDKACEAGHVSGTVYAVSTAGGILATFLCGFWLIPALGLNACLLIFGGLLLAVNLAVGRLFKGAYLVALGFVLYLQAQVFLQKDKNLLLSSDGLLGRLEVKQTVSGADTFRYLSLNGIIQTEMFLHSAKKAGNYLDLFDTLLKPAKGRGQALLLGLGGGMAASLLSQKNYQTDAVEIDQRIIAASRRFFFLDARVNAVCDDARHFLNTCNKVYDVVVFDVFKAEEQPGHVLTRESLERLKQNLGDSSLLIINWHGYLQGEAGRGTALLYSTLASSGFGHIKLCALPGSEDARNIVFVASQNPLKLLPYELGEMPQPLLSDVNTDDRPLMEKYNALANKKWRANYLRFFQGHK